MPSEAPAPIELPAEVWSRPDVLDMCRRRDAGALLRLANSSKFQVSQGRLAYWMDTEPGVVNKMINGKSGDVVRLDKWERIADALNMPDKARLVLGIAPQISKQQQEPDDLVVPGFVSDLATEDEAYVADDEVLTSLSESLSDLLASFRKGAGWTQRQLADRIGYSRTTIGIAETAVSSGRIGSEAFWKRCDAALAANGVLHRAYLQLAEARAARIRERERNAEHARQQKINLYRLQLDAAPLTAVQSARAAVDLASRSTLQSSIYSADDAAPDSDIDIKLLPTVADTARDEEVNRRELLRIISLAGSLVAASGVEEKFRLFDLGEIRDLETLDDFRQLNTSLWGVYSLSQSKSLSFPLVQEHLDVLTGAFGSSTSDADRNSICLMLGDLLQLAGEILFDLNRYTDAAHCYVQAAAASKEVRAFDLWGCALTRHSFISIYDRRFRNALPLLDVASKVARRGDSTLSTRYWVSVVRAQAFAGIGDLDACRRALDEAEHVHDLTGNFQNGGWLRFDGSRLAEERGRCFVELRRPDLAEIALTDALRQRLSPRRRGSVLSDLAMLGVQSRDRDQILYHAMPAVEIAEQTGSGVLGRKLDALRTAIAPLGADRELISLASRIGALSAGSSSRGN